VLGDLELGLSLVRQLSIGHGHCTEGEHGGFRPRADLLLAVSGSVQAVAESVVPGDGSPLQVRAGVRVVTELVLGAYCTWCTATPCTGCQQSSRTQSQQTVGGRTLGAGRDAPRCGLRGCGDGGPLGPCGITDTAHCGH